MSPPPVRRALRHGPPPIPTARLPERGVLSRGVNLPAVTAVAKVVLSPVDAAKASAAPMTRAASNSPGISAAVRAVAPVRAAAKVRALPAAAMVVPAPPLR